MQSEQTPMEPDIKFGLDYWNTQPATYNGVLGGYGNGTLPRVDALGSRQFLLYLVPELCTVPSAIKPLDPTPPTKSRTRALDVGAGVGRVTSDVLLHLIDDVVLVEPVGIFINEALARGKTFKGIATSATSVTFLQSTIQSFNPQQPTSSSETKNLGRIGFVPTQDDHDSGFDVIWCQWCLGHLSDEDLIKFFKRSKRALRNPENKRSLIVVKENLCSEPNDDVARTVFDPEDSSLTRSDMAWKELFTKAGLRLVSEKVQMGLPDGLYVVKMYGLR